MEHLSACRKSAPEKAGCRRRGESERRLHSRHCFLPIGPLALIVMRRKALSMKKGKTPNAQRRTPNLELPNASIRALHSILGVRRWAFGVFFGFLSCAA